MLSTQPLPTVHAPAAPAGRRAIPGVALVGAAAAIALLPPLVTHARWLWAREHYQFFPLVLVGAAALAYRGLRGHQPTGGGSPIPIGAGLIAAWTFLAGAVALGSGWLAAISVMTLIPTLAYAAGGRETLWRTLPAWALLWVIVPPPFDLDRLLIFRLQEWTTGWKYAALDTLGVLHTRAGNVLEVDGRRLMVEQACSGINSLFSVLACGLFLAGWWGRGWARGAVLVGTGIGWVLAANVARVVAVAWAETRWGITASTGWRHEALGLAAFAVAVGLLLSTDRLTAFLAGPRTARPPAPDRAPSSRLPGRVLAAGTVAFLLLAIGAWATITGGPATPPAAAPVTRDASLLPEVVGGWARRDFATSDRDSHSYFGESSASWVYARGGETAVVSLDYPFPDWHDLTWCYVATGWRLDGFDVRETADGGYVEARFSRPGGRFGHLAFSQFDRAGRLLAARPVGGMAASRHRHEVAVGRLRERLGLGAGPAADPAAPVYQFQVFVEGPAPLTPAGVDAVRELLLGGQAAVRAAWAGGGR